MTVKIQPDVSVVIPTVSRPKLLREAIASASRAADTLSVEIIVVDDSLAGTQWQSLPAHIVSVPTYGVGLERARNAGIALAQGRYIQFLDDDDLLFQGKLKVQVEALDQCSSAAIACGDWVLSHRSGESVWQSVEPTDSTFYSRLLTGNPAPLHAYLFPTAAVRLVGGFDPTSCDMEDWDLLIRLAARGLTAIRTSDAWCEYRFHGGNMMCRAHDVFRDADRWLARMHTRAGRDVWHDRASREALAQLCLMAFSHVWRTGESSMACWWLQKATVYAPSVTATLAVCDAVREAAMPCDAVFLPASTESGATGRAEAILSYVVRTLVDQRVIQPCVGRAMEANLVKHKP